MKRLNNLPLLKERRVELRKNQTPEETFLWQKLRQNKLGVKFKRQHSVGPYIIDFYCPSKKLAIELDGFHHKENKEYDAERFKYLSNLGIQTLRFWNHEVNDNIDAVMKTFNQRLASALLRGRWSKTGGGKL